MNTEDAKTKTTRPLAKHWCATIPNYSVLDEVAFQTTVKSCSDYFVYGKEVGENGLKHLQCFVSFTTKKTLASVIKMIPKAGDWQIKYQKSTMARASNYCKKGIFLKLCAHPLSVRELSHQVTRGTSFTWCSAALTLLCGH